MLNVNEAVWVNMMGVAMDTEPYPVVAGLLIRKARGRPWRYSVIPSTPDFPTEYQIRWHSNPAGLPTFAAIWGPDFMASIIRLTCSHVFKQTNKNRITFMTMFKANRGPPN